LKRGAPGGHRGLLRLVSAAPERTRDRPDENELDVAVIYARHGQFMWKSLFRMGVPEADLPDALQEVLLVVHRRLGSFDGQCLLTTWLFGICLRVAATLKRTRRRRREQTLDLQEQSAALTDGRHPEQNALLGDALDPEKRAVFVMFELEGVGCAEIAELLGVPKGTVFSRLSHARRAFIERLERFRKIEASNFHALGAER
jgi:RNA polymerase sigma-70 factor (ECF subfamily)